MEPTAIRCPADHALVAFVGRQLPTNDSDRIREHLDVCDACRLGIMAGLSRRHTEPAAFAANADTGIRLGHFEIVRRLGAGGMGVVYEAIDQRLGRAVALKLLNGEHDDSQLLVEARAMAQVRHPSVLTVFEAGHYEGSVYLVTELIRGTTLRDHINRTRPALRELFALFARAAEGLAAAHAHGIIHRDFKPDNVLVETGEATRVLVADFGLATAAAPGQLAEGSGLAGTPAYMAPEQLDGGPIDARVDVFAFCVSLWEALFGARPFTGQTLDEMRAAIRIAPRRPKTPALPRRLRDLLDRGLAADPDDRPSLAELIAALRPRARRGIAAVSVLIAIVAAAAWPSSSPPDVSAACRATATPARTTAGWQQRAIATGVPAWVQHRIATTLDARDREVTELQSAVCSARDDDARRAWIACRREQGIAETELALAVGARWHSYDRLDDALELPWPSECMSKAARLDAVVDPADPSERAALDAARGALSRGRLAVLSGAPAAQWHAELDRARHALPAVRDAIEIDALLDEAALDVTLDSRMRVSLLEHAVEAAERGGFVTATARAWLALAKARGEANADAASIDLAFAQASWAIDRAGDPPMLRARWHAVSAERAWQRSDLADADRHAHAAAALAGADPLGKRFAGHALAAAAAAHADFTTQRKLLESLLADPSAANDEPLHGLYAECLYHLGELGPARVEAEHTLAIARATVGDRDPETARALLIRGFIELDEGHPADCVRTANAAIEILIATVGRDHALVGSTLNLRSSASAALEDWKSALADSEAAAALFEARLGRRSEEAIFARAQIGEQARMLGDLDRARTALTGVLDDSRATYGADDPRTADAERSLAAVVSRDQARALLEHALAVHERAHTDPRYLAQCQAALAKLLDDDHRRSRALAERALTVWRDQPAWKDDYEDLSAWLRHHRT